MLLGILVTFHEFGHYIIARWSGVQILRFSVGFGKPLLSKVDERGTEWTVAAIPFGGYVRMLDDRDPEQAAQLRPGEKAYMDLHPKWRVAIALGGPFANFLLAIVVYFILQLAGVAQLLPVTDIPEPDSPVAMAGLDRPGEIIAVDGRETRSWQAVGLSLTRRLGETGNIALDIQDTASGAIQRVQVPINAWHEGVGDPDVIQSLGLRPTVLSIVGEVVAGTPAATAGLQAGDWVLEANGVDVSLWSNFVKTIEANPGQTLTLLVQRDGTALQLLATPGTRAALAGEEAANEAGASSTGYLGVGPKRRIERASVGDAFPGALQDTWERTGLILSVLGKMVTGSVSVKNLSGPISIAQVAGDSAQYGWRYFLGILAFLSISLGVLNLLPIPILDGGHVVFSSVEWATGRPVPEQVQIWGVQIGLVLLGSMMIFATYNDVLRLFG